jgi:hypothetical protein
MGYIDNNSIRPPKSGTNPCQMDDPILWKLRCIISYQQNDRGGKATRFGLVVRGLGSVYEIIGSILISNIVNKKKEIEEA